ncbi:vacuolar Zn-iron permease [Histoplasma capsulatum]|uniref:Vacuolar Zn-iron permease n=1 Tax=Ajellomyces capsulatus TaxID=5037 RepID=A0A8A1MIR1_AJECA|nr:vacuolar Zn-iron permease [Histoplasma capsulatum]
MGLDNDIRGWVMSCVSGIACVLGSSIICVDVIARNCFGLKNFKISDSNVFLSASLSLSAGVLLFSSLYSVLPTSKDYFVKAGLSSSAAASALIGLFLAGMVIIQLVSSFIHRHIPSRVVDCMHTHEHFLKGPGAANGSTEETQYHHSEPNPTLKPLTTVPTEHSSLLPSNARSEVPSTHRTSVQNSKLPVVSRIKCKLSSLVPGNKPFCDQDGTCYGISHVCGEECAKIITQRHPKEVASRECITISPQTLEAGCGASNHQLPSRSASGIHQSRPVSRDGDTSLGIRQVRGHVDDRALLSSHSLDSFTHHHHVPQNAFLAIGVQTSLAIALHKLPEGFITYATNHANPTLGFSIFMALFIHNITEGFAMTLPLYLALHSKLKAMLWSSLLGGVSQPAGAGLAALWIWSAGKADNGGGISAASGANPNNISWAVYGGMFAATAGVMTSVALQLFSEGLVLSHNRSLCVGFAFLGMGILGFSYALTG